MLLVKDAISYAAEGPHTTDCKFPGLERVHLAVSDVKNT